MNLAEVQKFAKDAPKWWNESGPFAPLHRLNPARLGYIKQQLCAHFGRDVLSLKPFEGLSVLDIGCGGGLVCEPMARLGASVTGADADGVAIDVAREHAVQSGLAIEYIQGTSEQIQKQYDAVLALEIIEHVDDPQDFVRECARLVKPGGMVIFSTLNRTPKSFALGVVAAEYILRWVPAGTHSWKKFVKPSELARHARVAGLQPLDISGLAFNPLRSEFALSKSDMGVNYFLTATKEGVSK